MLTLSDIAAEVRRLAATIDAPDQALPTYGASEDGARPHVEVDDRGYHYVVVERGRELERVTTHEADELLYRVFESVTFALAVPASRRKDGLSDRRVMFSRQLGLLGALSAGWAARKAADHQRTLRDHPFEDAIDTAAAAAVPDPAHRIYPAHPDALVYDEGGGRTIRFDGISLAGPPRVRVPAADRWAAETPAWAHGRRDLVVGRLFGSGCVVFEAGAAATAVRSPDGAFRIESVNGTGGAAGPPAATRVVSLPAEAALFYLPGYAVVDAAGFDGPGRVDLQLVGPAGPPSWVRLDLHARTYQPLPPSTSSAGPRPLDLLRTDLASTSRLRPPPLPRAVAAGGRPRPAGVLGDAAGAAAGAAFAAGGLWMALTSGSAADRWAGAAGALVFGAAAVGGARGLARAVASGRQAGVAAAPPAGWLRLAAYVPLVAVLAEVPWVVACALFVMFLVGDAPFRSTPATEHLFQLAVVLPAAAGLAAGVAAALFGVARTSVQRVCLAVGSLLCAGLVWVVVADLFQ